MSKWTKFIDKLPEEGQTVKVQGQWPITLHAYFRKHKLGYAFEEIRSHARLIVCEFKPKAIWMPITLPEAANE